MYKIVSFYNTYKCIIKIQIYTTKQHRNVQKKTSRSTFMVDFMTF